MKTYLPSLVARKLLPRHFINLFMLQTVLDFCFVFPFDNHHQNVIPG